MYTSETTEHATGFFEKLALLAVMVYELLKGGMFLLALEYWQVLLEFLGVKDGPKCRF